VIALTGLRYRYAQESELVFDDLQLPAGEHLLLRGASGSGKSTLLALMAGLLSPSAGQVVMAGVALNHLGPRQRDAWRGAHLGFVPQRLHLSAALSVADNLALPLLCAGLPPQPARVAELLDRLGLAALSQRLPHQLSVGQTQRVALARALMRRPRILLADEPSASLDDANTAQVLALLLQAATEQKASLVLATHDARVARHLAGLPGVHEHRLADLSQLPAMPA
jgi:putative ABC transport system ATP-binding protein